MSQFQFLSFVTIWVFEFCHNLNFWVLSQFFVERLRDLLYRGCIISVWSGCVTFCVKKFSSKNKFSGENSFWVKKKNLRELFFVNFFCKYFFCQFYFVNFFLWKKFFFGKKKFFVTTVTSVTTVNTVTTVTTVTIWVTKFE